MGKEPTGGKAFDDLAKVLVRVPKKEVLRQAKRWRERKKNKKK